MNLFTQVVSISMNYRVDQALPHRDSDFVLIVFAKTQILRLLQYELLAHVDALQRRVENGFAFHVLAIHARNGSRSSSLALYEAKSSTSAHATPRNLFSRADSRASR